jgi:hypothetical protein
MTVLILTLSFLGVLTVTSALTPVLWHGAPCRPQHLQPVAPGQVTTSVATSPSSSSISGSGDLAA